MNTILLLVCGAGFSIMAMFNGKLGTYLNAFEVSFFVHIIGLVMLLGYWLIKREKIKLRVPWHIWLIGFFGVVMVSISSFVTPHIGVSLTSTMSVVGSLVSSAFVDHFAWFGMKRVKFTPQRIPGFAIIGAGVFCLFLF